MIDFNAPGITTSIDDNGREGTVVIEPLERGFGNTLGNALRRVMLSSLPGAAAVYIKIDGVLHEFSTLPGIKEDICEIVLNIKCIVAKMHTDAVKTAYIDMTGPCIVTAADIRTDSELEIINPEQVIATLGEGGSLRMELAFAKGRGYTPADKNKEHYVPDTIGVIAVDSIFTPVVKANYIVENTRVGNITDFDRLIIDVKTNGSITPVDAVSLASSVLIKHFECTANLSEADDIPEMITNDKTKKTAMLDTSIDELEFSVRSYNCLKRAGINTLGELTSRTQSEMMKIRNLGAKSYDEICEKLESMGLNFEHEDE